MTIQKRFDPKAHYTYSGQSYPAANADHIKRKHLDIAYATHSERQKLDIYLPDEGNGPFPVILFVHGGAFMRGDKSDYQVDPALIGLTRGYAVVATNYRLSWEAVFPALLHDAKAAVRWVRASAEQYGFDPTKIAAWGDSAGGHQVLMLGVSAGVPELEDLSLGHPEQSSAVQAVVDWYGPTNFLTMDEQLTANGLTPAPGTEHSGEHSPESLLLGGKLADVPDKVQAANPKTYVNERAAPILIQHGTNDPIVPYQQSELIATRLRQAIGEENVILELLEGAGHGGPEFESPENVSRVFDFLDERLGVR